MKKKIPNIPRGPPGTPASPIEIDKCFEKMTDNYLIIPLMSTKNIFSTGTKEKN